MDIIDQMKAAGIQPDNIPIESTTSDTTVSMDSGSQSGKGDIIDQMKAAGVKPDIQSNITASSSYGSIGDSIMAGVDSFNRSVERNLINTPLQAAASLVSDDFGGLVHDYMQKNQLQTEQASKIYPVAVAVGNAAALIGEGVAVAGALPAKLGLIGGGAVTGGVMGALAEPMEGQTRIGNILSGAVGGAVGGAAVKGTVAGAKGVGAGVAKLAELIKPIAQNIAKGIVLGKSVLMTSADDVIDETIKQTAGKNAGATWESAQPIFTSFVKTVKGQADKNYAVRDEIAKAAGVTVKFNNVATLLKSPDEFLDSTTTGLINKVLKRYDEGMSFPLAQKVVSKLGQKANDALVKGDTSIARDFNLVKDALLKDSDAAASLVPELGAAQNIANTFYRTTYAPLKEITTKYKLQDNFINEKFVNGFLKNVSSNYGASRAFTSAPAEFKQAAVMAHINALKAAKIDASGNFNPMTFGNELTKQFETMPILKNVGIDVQTIARTAQALGNVDRAIPKTMGAALLGGSAFLSPAITAVAAIPYAKFLYMAGKLMNNKTFEPVLKAARGMERMEPSIQEALMRKIGTGLIAAGSQYDREFSEKPDPITPVDTTMSGIRG